MYPQSSNNYQINLSGFGCWLTVIAVVWLLGALGLGWLVKSLAVLFVFLLLAPILGFIGFRWWIRRNLVQGSCPVCSVPLAGLNQAKIACPNCQTSLQVTLEGFQRYTPEGTVEVNAVEVSRDSATTTDVKEVSVEVLPPAEDDG